MKKSQFTLEGHLVKCETDPTGVYKQEDTLMEPLQYVSDRVHYELKHGKNCNLAEQCTLFASKAKINVFWKKNSIGVCPKETRIEEKISKSIDFSLWGNSTTTQTHFE